MNTKCQPETVRFSRLLVTFLILSYALFGCIEGMYAMLVLTLSTLLFTSKYSIGRAVLKFLNLFGFKKIFKLNPRYERSFFINREMEIFEESLRLIAGLVCVWLYFIDFPMASIAIAFFMSIMMLISSFFGFCISGLFYIVYKKILGKGMDE